MLSDMESNRDPAESLRTADRAAAAPYIDYPPTPRWYPWVSGLWAACFCLSTAIPDDSPYDELALVALVAVEIAFLTWYRRYRGTWPRGKAPAEVRRVMTGFLLGAAVVIGLLALVLWLAPVWVAAIAALVVVAPALAWYEKAYAAAAARTRARLG